MGISPSEETYWALTAQQWGLEPPMNERIVASQFVVYNSTVPDIVLRKYIHLAIVVHIMSIF
jgi:hypothetical protein